MAANRRESSADSAARFLAAKGRPGPKPRVKPLLVLQQIRAGSEYRYRDEQTGRVYTAVEARRIDGPVQVMYAPPLTDREVR